MVRTLPLAAAIALLASSGLVQGMWSHRWTASRELRSAVERLDRLPRDIGDWEGRDQELDRQQLKAARISGHLMRRYRNRRDGSAVTILLACGLPGPLAVHTPDICYQGVGYDVESDPEKVVVVDRPRAEFERADFRKQNAVVPQGLRIYWAWAASGTWKAPDNPRLAFAGSPILYKLYVIRETAGDPGRRDRQDPSLEFLKALLPAAGRALFSPS